MSENIEDSNIRSGFSYRCRLLRLLERELDATSKNPLAKDDHEQLLLDTDPYITSLTKHDKR
ncbi:hypothetical protein BH24PSE2_BH24PSE2_09030 [soil metagenome]